MYIPAQADLFHHLPKGLQALMQASQPNLENEAAAGVDRRRFLKVAAACGFAMGAFPLAAVAQTTSPAALPAATGLKPTQQPSAFVQIARDDTVTVTINRLDFGQGVQTGLPMILAEELDADWSRVKSRHGNADPAYIDPAFGSALAQLTGKPLRQLPFKLA